METAFKQFAGQLNQYDVALFFYAGHGMQVNGENYLLPVDAKAEDVMSLEFEAFEVSDVNKYFAMSRERTNIMILDACRDNPYRSWSRGGDRGFKAVQNQGAGTIIAYATREGQTASDGASGNNGLFTQHLVKQMLIPQNITEVFQNTRVAVLEASNYKQVPQEWNMLTGNFRFTLERVDAKDLKMEEILMDVPINKELAYYSSGFLDERDGQKYEIINVGNQVWMKENMNFEIKGSRLLDGNRYFSWTASREVCPAGWHLPSVREWEQLYYFLQKNDSSNESVKMKINLKGDLGRELSRKGILVRNKIPFDFTSSGMLSKGNLVVKGGTFFWTSDESFYKLMGRSLMYSSRNGLFYIGNTDQDDMLPCRCVRD